MALIADFKARFPEFPEATVDTWIPILDPIWPCYYGGSYENTCDQEIILNLLAHLMIFESSTSDEAPRSIMSQSVGDVSQTFSSRSDAGVNSDFFSSTRYGARFLLLITKNIGARFV